MFPGDKSGGTTRYDMQYTVDRDYNEVDFDCVTTQESCFVAVAVVLDVHVMRMGKSGQFTRVNPAKDVHFTRANQAKNVHLTRVGKPSKNWPFYPSG